MNSASAGAPVRIRQSTPADSRSIEAIYPRTFPDEDLLPLVRNLLRERADTMSLVAVIDTEVAGNIVFTRCSLDRGRIRAALLAPLAVTPEHQGHGIGTALIGEGLGYLREEGIEAVYVLGDPAYYGRFGFLPERSVRAPYPLPAEWADAWQSQRLGKGTTRLSGILQVPDAWLNPALWSP